MAAMPFNHAESVVLIDYAPSPRSFTCSNDLLRDHCRQHLEWDRRSRGDIVNRHGAAQRQRSCDQVAVR